MPRRERLVLSLKVLGFEITGRELGERRAGKEFETWGSYGELE